MDKQSIPCYIFMKLFFCVILFRADYSGSQDHLGTPQSPLKTSHISIHTRTIGFDVIILLLQPAQNSCERVGVYFSVGCINMCEVIYGGDVIKALPYFLSRKIKMSLVNYRCFPLFFSAEKSKQMALFGKHSTLKN